MKHDNVCIDGQLCRVYYMLVGRRFLAVRKQMQRDDRCPICGEGYAVGDEVCLFINNYKLFPNTLTHKRCINTNALDKSVVLLQLLWKEAEKYKGWFQ